MQTIYCDEAGYTGNKLFDAEQPYFAYASVATTNEEARVVLQEAIARFRLQMPEIKGAKLVKSNRGKDAALFILSKFYQQSLTMVVDKLYAVAGKFYEYMFDPILGSHGMLFYQINFHRFISTALYVHYIAQDELARAMLVSFEQAMRSREFHPIQVAGESIAADARVSPFTREVLAFCTCHQDTIQKDLGFVWGRDDLGSWSLELTMTALHNLLGQWSERFAGMTVCCDDSKPLLAQLDILNESMVNRGDRLVITLAGSEQVIAYNLAVPIQLASSIDNPALQVADVFASAVSYMLRHPQEAFSQSVLQFCDPHVNLSNVFPEPEKYADPYSLIGYINTHILHLLLERTLKGDDLYAGLSRFIMQRRRSYPQWLRKMERDRF